ncbi:MAG: ParB N-terminal domain-containing protein [Deltaproteobacteria bacterium]|nr:ParB N-terminal domain-containing protein [Deltaproteobacteria bacterium]
MAILEEGKFAPEFLLLDPNNYRFQDLEGFVYAAEDRFHEESVQKRAYLRLRQEETLQALKNSILRNGYITVERIVVRPYAHFTDKRWIVIEGNRRLAAVKWIIEDHGAGVDIPQDVLDSIKKLPVLIAEQTMPDQIFRASLMGIRHVSGTKQWGGYQRAKLVASMRDDLKLEATEVAERLAMSATEVNRRYRAFKALQQMQNDEEFGGYAKPSMYPLFHEAISIQVVKNWLGWNDDTSEFTNHDALFEFFNLITPSEDEEGNTKDQKITTYLQVRELRSILPKHESKHILLDPNRPFQEALSAAKMEELSHIWVVEVSAAIRSLESMGVKDLKTLTDEDAGLIRKLAQVANERLSDHQLLKTAN